MNPYFWLFAVWGLLITPVTVQTGVWFSHGFHWKLQIVVSGIPVMEKQRKKMDEPQKAKEMNQLLLGWFSPRRRMASALFRDGTMKKFIQCFRCEGMQMMARISFQDAAATAIVYSLIRTVLEMLHHCGMMPDKLVGRVAVDFQAQGTALMVQGIFSARLGTIAIAGFRLLISALRHHAELALEDKTYAASR